MASGGPRGGLLPRLRHCPTGRSRARLRRPAHWTCSDPYPLFVVVVVVVVGAPIRARPLSSSSSALASRVAGARIDHDHDSDNRSAIASLTTRPDPAFDPLCVPTDQLTWHSHTCMLRVSSAPNALAGPERSRQWAWPPRLQPISAGNALPRCRFRTAAARRGQRRPQDRRKEQGRWLLTHRNAWPQSRSSETRRPSQRSSTSPHGRR